MNVKHYNNLKREFFYRILIYFFFVNLYLKHALNASKTQGVSQLDKLSCNYHGEGISPQVVIMELNPRQASALFTPVRRIPCIKKMFFFSLIDKHLRSTVTCVTGCRRLLYGTVCLLYKLRET